MNQETFETVDIKKSYREPGKIFKKEGMEVRISAL